MLPLDESANGSVVDSSGGMRVCLVGPLPPPSGGMANQADQLARLLKLEGVSVEFVQTNAPVRPAWMASVPMARAVCRLMPYLVQLWKVAGRVDVMHVFANSGWAWHLFASPAIMIARLRKLPVIVNYRGGQADAFFLRAPSFVLALLGRATMRVTPSVYLQRVFARHGLRAAVIPNIIDLSRFTFSAIRPPSTTPCIVVTRNLEKIYDIPMAIRVLGHVKSEYPNAHLIVAGSGPELEALQTIVQTMALSDSVTFTGRVNSANMPALYAKADCMINPSTVDNMPNSLLEAFACGVLVVSTNAGGIPDMVVDGVSALLSPVGDDLAMARNVLRVLRDPDLAATMRQAGMAEASKYAWPQVKLLWLQAYRDAASPRLPS